MEILGDKQLSLFMWNEIFDGIDKNLFISCYWPEQRPSESSLSSILWSFIGLWVNIGNRNRSKCTETNSMQSSRSTSCASQRKGRLLRLQSKQQSYFRWRWAKAWKLCLAWFWIDHNQSLQPSWLHMPVKRDVESHVETSIDWTSFDFWFEDLIEICLWKYSSTGLLINHMKLISKICLTFKLSVITILLLNEHWATNVQSENNSTPLYVQCDIMYQLKVCCQDFLYIESGLDIQQRQPCPANIKIGSRLRYATSFFSIDQYQLIT